MSCAFSRKSGSVKRTTKRKALDELVKTCQEHLLPSIQRLVTDLKNCLDGAGVYLDNAQRMVNSCAVNQKKGKERMSMGKGNRVDAGRSIYVTAGMGNEFWQLSLNNPFWHLDMKEFHTLTENLKQAIEELQNRKGEINESLRSIKQSHNVWNAVLTIISIGVQVCSLVLLVLGIPPVLVAAGTTTGTVINTALKEWIGSIWERRKRALEEEKLVVEKLQAQLQVSLYDHQQSIESLVRKVKNDYSALAVEMQHLATHQHDEEALNKVMAKLVMAKLNGEKLNAAISSLENKVDKYKKKIQEAEKTL